MGCIANYCDFVASAEMFLTAALCLVVLMVNVEKNKTTILFPLALGFTLWATHLAALRYTGSAVNTGTPYISFPSPRN